MTGIENQPVNRIRWVHRSELHANDYNPNRVAPPELELLIISIVEDGWTQPIVVNPDMSIVDGFHRWTVSDDPRVYNLTDGFVPVVDIEADKEHRMMSTIRHNRARGTHVVIPMSEILEKLVKSGMQLQEIQVRLGMEEEEITRLLNKAGMPTTVHNQQDGFTPSWVPDVK